VTAGGQQDPLAGRGKQPRQNARATASGGPGQRAAASADGGSRPSLSYEQARDELTELVSRLEAGGLTLEESLQLWERGEELAAICEEWLEGARARLATALARRGPEPPADPSAPF
jgi:exodeoxyribonuclease VII small subunit